MFNHWIHKELENYEFVLCSGSPRRYDILKQLGINPVVEKSNFKEDFDKELYVGKPVDYVKATGLEKLKEVVGRIDKDGERGRRRRRRRKGRIYLSADTVIICDGKIYEKPKSIERNVSMLKELRDKQANGSKLEIVTCCAMFNNVNDESLEFEASSYITLCRDLQDSLIEEYCLSEEGLEVAGGFKIQGFGMILFESINGDFYNCVGLPGRLVFQKLGEILKK